MAILVPFPSSDPLDRASSLSLCPSEVLSSDHDCDRSLLSSFTKTSSSSSTPPSLYAASKVLALVKGFRQRVRAHSQLGSRTAIASEFERQAFEEIDKYLGRKPRGVKADARDCAVAESLIRKRINELLFELESPVKYHKLSLKEVASNNTLLLNRKTDFTIDLTPLRDLQHLRVVVKDLRDTLHRIAPPHPSASAFPAGKFAADPTLDFTYIADLEDLLLCLQQQLFCLLLELCAELLKKHIAECQKDHDRYCKEWFFEYPNVRHPLSTTWPWNIKPSLVVLWGVCWMFLALFHWDPDMNLVETATNRVAVPSNQAAQLIQWMYQQQNNNLVNLDYGISQAPGPPGALTASMARMPQPPSGTQPSSSQHHPRLLRGSHRTRQAAGPPPNLGVANTNISYGAQPAPTSQPDQWRPENPGVTLGQQQPLQTDAYGNNAYGAQQADSVQWPSNYGPEPVWPLHQQDTQPAHNAPRPENSGFRISPQGSQVPTIITDFPNNSPYVFPPQGSHPSSATSYHSPLPFHQPQDQFLTPQRAQRQSFGGMEGPLEQQQQQDANPSQFRDLEAFGNALNGNHGSQPIVAQRSPSRSPGPEQLSRKRSHSQMRQQELPIKLPYGQPHEQHLDQQFEHHHEQQQEPNYEEREPSQSADDGMRAKTIKRPDPPMTADHKYYCDHSKECDGQLFDRKCEWSKHMDKHDRPYTCPQPACAKLQGFTYSGGLLRHEREVHGKHGGPREQLRCTFAGCKRTTGKGFTRKENLNEHLRRVHGVTSPEAAAQLRQTASDALPGAEAADPTSAGHFSDGPSIGELTADSPYPPIPPIKRRKHDITSPTSVTSDVESELARLRQENQEKDERIQRVEQDYASTQERLRVMEEMLSRLTGPLPAPATEMKEG